MKRKWVIAVFACILFMSSGCQSKYAKISTTVYPIQYVVERIAGEDIKVVNISDDGLIQTAGIKDGHDKTLKKSDALLYISELEPYFDVYRDSIRNSEVDVINLASKMVLYKFQRYSKTYVDGKNVIVESPYYDSELFNEVDVYKNDPYIWMDPISMISVSEIVRDYLSEKYPDYKKTFEKNFKELEYDLTMLDVEYQELKNVQNPIAFVSMSPSFGVWQKTYGVKVYPICISKYGAIPSEQQLEVMKERIIEDGVQYIVHEQNLNTEMEAVFKELESELGLQRIELSNISSLSKGEKKQNKDYLTIMYENLIALEEMGQ